MSFSLSIIAVPVGVRHLELGVKKCPGREFNLDLLVSSQRSYELR